MKTKKFLSGLALGALVGSALGLFLNPTTGKKNRDKFSKTAKQVSETLIKEAGKISNLSKKEYEAIVENIIKKYSKEDLMTKGAWKQIGDELKLRWKDVNSEMRKAKPSSSGLRWSAKSTAKKKK